MAWRGVAANGLARRLWCLEFARRESRALIASLVDAYINVGEGFLLRLELCRESSDYHFHAIGCSLCLDIGLDLT